MGSGANKACKEVSGFILVEKMCLLPRRSNVMQLNVLEVKFFSCFLFNLFIKFLFSMFICNNRIEFDFSHCFIYRNFISYLTLLL